MDSTDVPHEPNDHGLTGIPITHTAEIPEGFIDEMGHMNVMWYTHLFDHAIFGIFRQLGCDYDFMKKHNAGCFALESHIRYLSEVAVGQTVTLRTRVIGRSDKRFHLVNFMTNESKENLASTFEVVGAYIDMKQRRMAPIPESIALKFDKLIAAHQKLDWDAPLCGVMQP